jgi:hypothetical protein
MLAPDPVYRPDLAPSFLENTMVGLIDMKRVHMFELADDNGARTKFHVRTLTRLQRIAVIGVVEQIRTLEVRGADGGVVPERYAEMMKLAYRAWEMLVVDVTCIDGAVDKRQGEFGACVPAAWVDGTTMTDAQVLAVVYQALQANMPDEAAKKACGGLSTGADLSPNTVVPSASSAESSADEDAPSQARSPGRISMEHSSGSVPLRVCAPLTRSMVS